MEPITANSPSEFLKRYRDNRKQLLTKLQQQPPDLKYAAMYHTIEYGDMDMENGPWNESLSKINKIERDSDLVIAPLIRVLYKAGDAIVTGQLTMERDSLSLSGSMKADDNLNGSLHSKSTSLGDDGCCSPLGSTSSIALSRQDSITSNRLILTEEKKQNIKIFKGRICTALNKFPFWPERIATRRGVFRTNGKDMKNLVFWTEHHIFLLLSSGYLFNQYMLKEVNLHLMPNNQGNHTTAVDHKKFKILLTKYLDAHCKHHISCFEVNSHVYLSYTMAALLNLLDLAEDIDIQEKSRQILNTMVFQLMLSTDPLTKTGNLCASARNPPRILQRTFGHTMGQFLHLMTNDSESTTYDLNYLSGFLATTSWLPEERAFHALHGSDYLACKMSCNWSEDELARAFGGETIEEELMPMYWSAGGMIQQSVSKQTNNYIDKYDLGENCDLKILWAVGWVSWIISVHHFVNGQSCLGIRLNVYKQPGLVLSSFEMFHPHFCGFEQYPWMLNLSGIPLWSRSGTRSWIRGLSISNTHNPAIQQLRDVLVASYITPPRMRPAYVRAALSSRVSLMWPYAFFEEHVTIPYCSATTDGPLTDGLLHIKHDYDQISMTWIIGMKEGNMVAAIFTKPCFFTKGGNEDFFRVSREDKEGVPLHCLYSDDIAVSIIVVVGTRREYPTIKDFITRRLSRISIDESIYNNQYSLKVTDSKYSRAPNMLTAISYNCDMHNPREVLINNNPMDQYVTNTTLRTYRQGQFPFEDEQSLLKSKDLIEIPINLLRSIDDPNIVAFAEDQSNINEKLESDLVIDEGVQLTSRETIGEGTFGVVERCLLRISSNQQHVEVAVKIPKLLPTNTIAGDSDNSPSAIAERRVQCINELSLIKRFSAVPYLVQCYGFVVYKNIPALVLEHIPYGSLYDAINAKQLSRELFPVGICCEWLRDIAGGLKYLHEFQVVHRDLKPGNVLVDCGLKIKITDFGASKFQKDLKDDETAGTFVYSPPELRVSSTAVPSSDIFSLAMTALHIFNNRIPEVSFQVEVANFSLESRGYGGTPLENAIRTIISKSTKYDLTKQKDYGRPSAKEIFGDFNNILSDYSGLVLDETDRKVIEICLEGQISNMRHGHR